MKTSIRDRLPEVSAQVRQVPDIAREAVRRALNATARSGSPAVYAAMRRVFDRPTPYALNSLRVEEASTGGQLLAAVMIKGGQDVTGGGVPAQSFLRAEITGGARRWKRFEVALMRRGVLPRGWYAVPGQGARRDQWGNMPGGQVVQIMAALQAFGMRGTKTHTRANMTVATRSEARAGKGRAFGTEIFAVMPGAGRGGLQPGVYQRDYIKARRSKRAVGPVAPLRVLLVFVKAARYRQRLDYFGELQAHAAAAMPIEVDKALRQVRAARPLKDAR